MTITKLVLVAGIAVAALTPAVHAQEAWTCAYDGLNGQVIAHLKVDGTKLLSRSNRAPPLEYQIILNNKLALVAGVAAAWTLENDEPTSEKKNFLVIDTISIIKKDNTILYHNFNTSGQGAHTNTSAGTCTIG